VTRRASGIVAAAASGLLVIAGCTATPLPEGPSDAEIEKRVATELDWQWGLTGLEGVVARPVVELKGPPSQYSIGFGECMSDAGFSGWGYDDSGLVLDDGDPTDEQRLAFYVCNAEYPSVDPLSTAQLEYVYDYYERWLIPCLALHGYEQHDPVPTRESFVGDPVQDGFRWSPYSSIYFTPATESAYVELQAECDPAPPGGQDWGVYW
jgi:hypothetical protein